MDLKGSIIFLRKLKSYGSRIIILWIIADIFAMVFGAPLRRVSQITPQLHLGEQYTRRGWSRLAARGVTAVVNLRAEFDDREANIAPSHYLYLPTGNDEPPTLNQLRQAVTFIKDEIAQGGAVYVHCRSGVGRSAVVVVAYLLSTGLTPDEAWTKIRRARPFVRLNRLQQAQLERFVATNSLQY